MFLFRNRRAYSSRDDSSAHTTRTYLKFQVNYSSHPLAELKADQNKLMMKISDIRSLYEEKLELIQNVSTALGIRRKLTEPDLTLNVTDGKFLFN